MQVWNMLQIMARFISYSWALPRKLEKTAAHANKTLQHPTKARDR